MTFKNYVSLFFLPVGLRLLSRLFYILFFCFYFYLCLVRQVVGMCRVVGRGCDTWQMGAAISYVAGVRWY